MQHHINSEITHSDGFVFIFQIQVTEKYSTVQDKGRRNWTPFADFRTLTCFLAEHWGLIKICKVAPLGCIKVFLSQKRELAKVEIRKIIDLPTSKTGLTCLCLKYAI